MTATRKNAPEPARRRRPPATTPEARANQLIAMSYDAAEDQIRSGKATSQLLTHFLKLGTARENLEVEKLRQENELLKAKRDAIESQKRVEELYKTAMDAFRSYSGQDVQDDYED